MTIDNLEEKVNEITSYLTNTVKELKHNISDIESKQKEWTEKIEIINNKNSELLNKQKKLDQLQEEYIDKFNLLSLKEKQLEKDEEEGRKVSILKNIQVQLSQKTSECELLNKQLKLYKSRCELLNNLCNKFNISIESLEVIIEKMIVTKEVLLDIEPKKIELTHQELRNIDMCKENVSNDNTNSVKENVSIDNTNSVKENCNENDIIEPEQEESIEVDIFNYKGKQYYIDNNSGDIYAKLEDDEVGDIIGFKNEKGIVKFGLRKK